MSETKMNLMQRINAVRKEVSYIQKDKSVSTGGGSYKAVTHDAVTALIRDHMATHGIVSWPFLVDSTSQPKEEGVKQFRYEATYDFTFCSVDDPADKMVIRIQAHAMDNADKAPGKALSYGMKYALLKLFMLETGESEESRFLPDGLDDSELSSYLDAISRAPTENELKEAFATSYRASTERGDKQAAKILIKAKDARKLAIKEAS